MFTGIVEGVGVVNRIDRAGAAARLVVDLGPLAAGVAVGESVAVDGACLTAAGIRDRIVDFDVSGETLRRTTLGGLGNGAKVNLERALRVGDRLGGHFVLGHVDGVGEVTASRPGGGQTTLEIAAAPEIVSRLVPKGSIAVSGVSLTIAELRSDRFAVAVIPHTLDNTTLPGMKTGQKVNLELDILGKYVERLLARDATKPEAAGGLSEDVLTKYGFA
jgi:riboflavin synthase